MTADTVIRVLSDDQFVPVIIGLSLLVFFQAATFVILAVRR